MSDSLKNTWIASDDELNRRGVVTQMFFDCPIPKNEILCNLGLFLNGPTLSRILFMNELYQKIIPVHGIVIEFGLRWGQNLALFQNFRTFYEPFNSNRKIVGFDTFDGFLSVSEKDGSTAKVNDYSVTPLYEDYLERLMRLQEQDNPIPHIKKFEIIKGDAPEKLKEYLTQYPETIIALAYFDFDLYKPTKDCLELIQDYVTKGSIIGFDELNLHDFPGETLAFKEVMGLRKYRISRSIYSRVNSFIEID
ncbi:MAG: crotonobetainyl-CoA--carnitine CoA-transferase [Thermodesulfobacteriota bacterium]